MCKGNEPHSRATQSDIACKTEDVPRKDQIFLEENRGSSNPDKEMAQKEAKAIADEAVKKTRDWIMLTCVCKNVAHVVIYLCSVNQNKQIINL